MKKVAMIFVSLSCLAQLAMADEVIELGKIVVTPLSGVKEVPLRATSYPAKVFTRTEIEKTGAAFLLDFLKKESSLYVSDFYGTGVIARVDIMGFGDSAPSNLLVLVNGRRVNDIDLSGVDWTQIPLHNIERIEIVKGVGTVLYGDNAAGGVINIITKEPAPGALKTEVTIEGGSYSTNKEIVQLSGGTEKISISTYAEHHSTDGYRRNGHYRSRYATINISSQLTEETGVGFDFSHHKFVAGLAGDLTETNLASGFSRRDSNEQTNSTELEDNAVGVTIASSITEDFKAMVDFLYKNKNGFDNLSMFNGINFFFVTDKKITNMSLKPQCLIVTELFGIHQEYIAGLEFNQSDYSADTFSLFSTTYADIDRITKAAFLQSTLTLTDELSLTVGTRVQREKFTFDYRSTAAMPLDDTTAFTEEAYEAGLNYQPSMRSNMFINFARGFRVPKTDEFLVVFPGPPQINPALKTQHSKAIIAGFNHSMNKFVTLHSDFFFMDVSDEIYLNPSSFANENYDEIGRKGINVEVRAYWGDTIEVSTGYNYLDAEFKSGSNKGNKVPLVPRSKLTASFLCRFLKQYTLFIDTIYNGKMYFINDVANTQGKYKDYWVTNMKVSFATDPVELFFGIRNIFDETYSEYIAVSTFTSDKGFYPSPQRHYFWGMKLNF